MSVTEVQSAEEVRSEPAFAAVVMAGDELAGSALAALLNDAGVAVVDSSHAPDRAVAIVVDPSDATWDQLGRSNLSAVLITDGELRENDVVGAVFRGACCLVGSDCSADDLLRAIDATARHGAALSPQHTRMVIDALRRRSPMSGTAPLTARERQILEAIGDGESVKQTARRLGVSPRTIDNTQRVLFLKLGVRNRAHAVARAHQLGLLDTETR